MPSIEYKPNGPDADQSVPKADEKEKLSYIVSTTSIESPLKSTESIQVLEIEDIREQSIDNPFVDPEVARYWADVYNKSKYEGRHFFEPTLTWTAAEEKKVVRRLDWHVCLWAVSKTQSYSKCLILMQNSCSVSCTLPSSLTVAISRKLYQTTFLRTCT